jgi:signal transduction histidine kinase
MKAARLERGPTSKARLADVREEERRSLARDLHDGPAQSMAAALFGVDLAITALDRTPAAARDELLRARELLRDALDDVRGLMSGLRPRLLEERGLVTALQALAGITPLWGPTMAIETRGFTTKDRLPPEIELALYRIAQEAISNARRHGAASHVSLILERAPGTAQLEVIDDGHGFPPQSIRPAAGRGEGLPGMRERASLLGGRLTIDSAPGSGTRILVSVPLPVAGVGLREGKQ